jgi:hypothetical protein
VAKRRQRAVVDIPWYNCGMKIKPMSELKPVDLCVDPFALTFDEWCELRQVIRGRSPLACIQDVGSVAELTDAAPLPLGPVTHTTR